MIDQRFEATVAITGIGQSAIGRRLGRSGLDLTVDAALAAIDDAGLLPADIDGVATFPGESADPGFAGCGVWELRDALDLPLRWFEGSPQTSGQLGPFIDASMAVACGLASHVLCFRTVRESSAQRAGGRADVVAAEPLVRDWRRWLAPFGAPSAANWIALYAQHHFERYGTTREQLGAIACNARANAALNPNAVFRDPLTLDDYLGARMISTPLCLYDCDVPVDGSTAVVVSARDRGRDGRRDPVHLEAVGCGLRGPFAWDQIDGLAGMAATGAAEALWQRTDLRPSDVDVAELYDGFSILALAWLEALGFCDVGDGGPFVDGGKAISLDGPLPLNTQGGQLSGGRLHGYGMLHEAVVQLRGDGVARQVRDRPEVAVVSAGGGPLAGCLLLTR
ncbi:MAG TPA: thiolase family protein [Acidimicrobiales bacterium]|nr:thiolase family protein [Acidimicrobiales bacterium]